jgi:hypothetical protein
LTILVNKGKNLTFIVAAQAIISRHIGFKTREVNQLWQKMKPGQRQEKFQRVGIWKRM